VSVVPNVRETRSDRLRLAGKQYLSSHRRDKFDLISIQYKLNVRNEQREDLCWKSVTIFLKTLPVYYFKYISSVCTNHGTGSFRTQNALSRTPVLLLKIIASKYIILCHLPNIFSCRCSSVSDYIALSYIYIYIYGSFLLY
jgi:hypothetical protein